MHLPFSIGQSVIEIGGGENPSFRPNVDIRPGPSVDLVADLNQKFPIQDSAYDGVYSSYIIEHISWRKIRQFISELFRILKPGGCAFIITANLKEQCRVLASKGEWEDSDVCMLFGDQNYAGDQWTANAHFTGFSPMHAIKLFNAAGFTDVTTLPHPNCKTDLIIEARKPMESVFKGVEKMFPEVWTKDDRQKAYNKDYFDGGKAVGGYAHEGYWDYPIHWNTARKVASYNPTSVLEIGCARGYVLKKIEDCGIRVKGLEVSKHCFHTRAIDDIVTWDITETPWPIKDKEFDLGFSIAVMEHIPEDKLRSVFNELKRTCKRSVHGISFMGDVDDFDKTHTTLKAITWWSERLPSNHQVVDKEWLEQGPADPPKGIGDDSVKLNIGSFTTMFYHNWINIDIHSLEPWAQKYGFKFLHQDATKGFKLFDNSVDLIYTSHFLEHLTYSEGRNFLSECHRMMKPGAVLRIIVPDAYKLTREYDSESIDYYDDLNSEAAAAPTGMGKLWALMCHNHQAAYDGQTLEKVLSSVGFSEVKVMKFRKSLSPKILIETIDMLPTISLYVDAVK